MATFFDASSLDLVLNDIKNSSDEVWLLDQYTQGDDWATVSANKIASATLSGAGADFTGPTASGNNRAISFDGKLGGTANTDSTLAQLHIALVDTVNSTIMACTDETSNQPITNGNTVDFPAFNMTMNQPTQA